MRADGDEIMAGLGIIVAFWAEGFAITHRNMHTARNLCALDFGIDLQGYLLRRCRIRKMDLILVFGPPTRALPNQEHKLALYRLNRHPIVVKFLVENENMKAGGFLLGELGYPFVAAIATTLGAMLCQMLMGGKTAPHSNLHGAVRLSHVPDFFSGENDIEFPPLGLKAGSLCRRCCYKLAGMPAVACDDRLQLVKF